MVPTLGAYQDDATDRRGRWELPAVTTTVSPPRDHRTASQCLGRSSP